MIHLIIFFIYKKESERTEFKLYKPKQLNNDNYIVIDIVFFYK